MQTEMGLGHVQCSLGRQVVCHFKRQREHFDIRVRALDADFALFQGLDLLGSGNDPLAPAGMNASERPWPKLPAMLRRALQAREGLDTRVFLSL
jgi:hypothetical protein